jgi:Na+-transporting NADH:ubiquinone oxidoreductase subunit NqrB
MKLISKILILIFVTFLLTPSIVSVIDKSNDTSFFYNMSEDELSKKEVKKFIFSTFHQELLISSKMTSKIILSENLSKHETISAKIFITPPDKA